MRRGIILAALCGFTFGIAFGLTSCKPKPQVQAQSAPPPLKAVAINNSDLAPVGAVPPVATTTIDTEAGGLNDDLTNQPPVYAEQPPPPLPDYSQPPIPGDNYYWTPGYWGYNASSYYWVPGEWVTAPWVGALWTPPYWNFEQGRYRFHHGYWASRVGFYGGVDYGSGYTGHGYYGGQWENGKFFYNRAATNVGGNAHNTYNGVMPRKIPNNATPRISYNGGRGGMNERPSAADVTLLHERRSAPQAMQEQHAHEAAVNRNQFTQTRPASPDPAFHEPSPPRVEDRNGRSEERRSPFPGRSAQAPAEHREPGTPQREQPPRQ